MSYPPKPAFSWLKDPQREQQLGRIEYQQLGDGRIHIVNNWAAENIVTVYLPQLARLTGRQHITFHHKAAGQIQRLWAAWEEAGLLDLVLTWDGAWVPRLIRGSRTVLSNHAYGTAFDINARWNPFYQQAAPRGTIGSVLDLVELANHYGFFWGGHWNYDGKGSCDAMHFEWAVPR